MNIAQQDSTKKKKQASTQNKLLINKTTILFKAMIVRQRVNCWREACGLKVVASGNTSIYKSCHH